MAVLTAAWSAPTARAQITEYQISEQLRRTLESASTPLNLSLAEEPVLATLALPAFYELRVYQPAWAGGMGPTSAAVDLLEFLDTVETEGLRANDYHANRIRELLTEFGENPNSVGHLVELDLLLTDAFLMLGAHLVSGRVDPASLDREWLAVRREVELVCVLTSALESADVKGALSSLLPDHPGYRRLREMGVRLRSQVAAGGWPSISVGPNLELGDKSPRVAELQRRLQQTDGLVLDNPGFDPELFDERVNDAVQLFQTRHGLDPDGVVGTRTLAALNVTAADRLRQVYLNLERWRWLPQSLGERYVLVNIPAYDLHVTQSDQTLLHMRVAVGRRYRHTPVFSDLIRYLVFNPYWEIPASIAIKDKVPEVRQDPTYLDKQGIRVFSGWGSEQTQVDPASIDWDALTPGKFPYRMRQDPGPRNALGRVKFMFPNPFNVYLHDTPGREVFLRPDRDVSSGCIRLEKPLELAELLLSSNSNWRPGAIQEILSDYTERTVRLDSPWPVHLLHWTAWVDEQHVLNFRSDLYERDARLSRALAGSLPDIAVDR